MGRILPRPRLKRLFSFALITNFYMTLLGHSRFIERRLRRSRQCCRWNANGHYQGQNADVSHGKSTSLQVRKIVNSGYINYYIVCTLQWWISWYGDYWSHLHFILKVISIYIMKKILAHPVSHMIQRHWSRGQSTVLWPGNEGRGGVVINL